MRPSLSLPRILLASFFALSTFVSAAPIPRARTLIVCDDVADPLTLDPQKEFSEKNHTIVQQMYEGLIRFDPNGKIEPALAVSWERLDNLRVRFKLREGVLFHNGEPFNAQAVKFSIERYLDPATGFPAVGFINSLDKVEIVDDSTVDIVTEFPDGLILNRLAGFILIVPPKYVREKGEDALSAQPVGTGAFKFGHWKKGDRIVLLAYRKYWEPTLPKVDSLVFRFIPTDQQVEKLLTGEVDIVTELPGTRTYDVQSSELGRIVKNLSLYTIASSLNVVSGPLKDIRVRQALNYGINKQELIRYDLLGNGEPISSYVLSGYPEAYQQKMNPYEYNIEKAKKLLMSAGFGDGMKLRMLEVKATRPARILVAQWKRLGVEVELVSTTDAGMSDELKKGNWDVFLSGCPDPMYHPYFIHSVFLYSLSPYCLTKISEADSYIERIVQELDPQKQINEIKSMANYVNENALAFFTYQRIKTYGVRKNVVFQPYGSGMSYFRETGFKKYLKNRPRLSEKNPL